MKNSFAISFPSALVLVLCLNLISCKKHKEPFAEITIDSLSCITHHSALVYIQAKHDPVVSSCGIMVAESSDDLIFNKLESCDTGDNILGVSNLKANTCYYIKAWVKVIDSNNGKELKFYSKTLNFNTPKVDLFTDTRDGQTYPTVKIGDNIWLANNLNYKTATGCYEVTSNENNINNFGKLYDYAALSEAMPEGWRLPTEQDILEIINTKDYKSNAASILMPKLCMYSEKFNSNKLGLGILFPKIPISEDGSSDSQAVFFLDNAKSINISKNGDIAILPNINYPYMNVRCIKIK